MRGRGSVEFAKFALAEHLHKSVDEIDRMTIGEWNGWQAYFAEKARRTPNN